ncbi:MAG: chorismate synthase [Lachnospiraceae bacterium]|nr:chorismate synthase [Lachnospiraceae bacterium]
MAGSTFGTLYRITTWGESHGPALGAVVDGCPAGLALREEDIQVYLDRRKPGGHLVSTPRKEEDRVRILSGVFEGRTTGTPISLMVENTSQHSSDYTDLAETYRPGHADYTYDAKYGFRDYRGGGRSSGRETVGRVAGGAIAALVLARAGISVEAYTASIGPVRITPGAYDRANVLASPVAMPDPEATEQALAFIDAARADCDSVGGTMECRIRGLKAGIGDPVFDKLDALLSRAVMSIGAVKAVEIGDGTAVSAARGSDNNDPFRMENGVLTKTSNHAGGILGGISDGSEILIRASVKPTPSIFRPQNTVTRDGQNRELTIRGRHDPVIVPRAVVVLETMCASVILDAMLCGMGSRLDRFLDFYR